MWHRLHGPRLLRRHHSPRSEQAEGVTEHFQIAVECESMGVNPVREPLPPRVGASPRGLDGLTERFLTA